LKPSPGPLFRRVDPTSGRVSALRARVFPPFLHALGLVALLTFPTGAWGQLLQGELINGETSRPIEGALVTLLDEAGQEVDGSLTNEQGRFLLRARVAGKFRVRAERIGFRVVTSELLVLSSGHTSGVRLLTRPVAIELEELQVRGEQRCVVRPQEGVALAGVWEEARKALFVQDWTDRVGSYRFEVVRYQRHLDRRGRKVLSETRETATVEDRIPIQSLSAEALAAEGFVHRLPDGRAEYLGPDASVLLSDVFLDTHCFHMKESPDRPGSIGLAFEPIAEEGHPDIAGTFWLDRKTAHLQDLEYTYTWAPYRVAEGLAGGRVEFEALPSGAWIVRKWWIRVPQLVRDALLMAQGLSGAQVAGVQEAGGEVTRVTTLEDEVLSQAPRGVLQGSVWDSTRAEALAGARVFLSGTSFAAQTDSSGRFRLEDLPGGVYAAGFSHPRLDSLGLAPWGVEIEVEPSEARELALAIPSVEHLLALGCREEARPAGTSVVVGIVRAQGSDDPIPGARVVAEWYQVERPGGVGVRTVQSLETHTDIGGRFRLCDVPADHDLRLRAEFFNQSSDVKTVRAAEREFAVHTLSIGLAEENVVFRSGGTVLESSGRSQGVLARFLDAQGGQPLGAAEVVLRERELGIEVAGVTNGEGLVRLRVPHEGQYALDATAMGYRAISDVSVKVAADRLAILEISMSPQPLELEPIVVRAEPRVFHLDVEGFYDRQRSGFGYFITPEDLERRTILSFRDLFRNIPRLKVLEFGPGFTALAAFSPNVMDDVACFPPVYVDGMLTAFDPTDRVNDADPRFEAVPGTGLENVVDLRDVEAVEVYLGPASTPLQWGGTQSRCGSVLIWTRSGG